MERDTLEYLHRFMPLVGIVCLNSTSQYGSRACGSRRGDTAGPHGSVSGDVRIRATALTVDALRAGNVLTIARRHRQRERNQRRESAVARYIVARKLSKESGRGRRRRCRGCRGRSRRRGCSHQLLGLARISAAAVCRRFGAEYELGAEG